MVIPAKAGIHSRKLRKRCLGGGFPVSQESPAPSHAKSIARRIGMESIMSNGLIVPLGLFLMVVLIVGITSMRKMRERELQAHQELRIREMEHERKLKEMEIEKAKLELEKAKANKSA
jgi:hypothetical protein